MAFDSLSPVSKKLAEAALKFLVDRHGRAGFKENSEIYATISWKPTFILSAVGNSIYAVEVSENIYPQVLYYSANDIIQHNRPIYVYNVCSLDEFQSARNQASVARLRDSGIGLITVDDQGGTLRQFGCPPLSQHITKDEFKASSSTLSPSWARPFRAAFDTYNTNSQQGLQEASQLAEHAIRHLARECEKQGLGANLEKTTAGNTVRALEAISPLASWASIAAAKSFVSNYRNSASHAPTNPREAESRIQKCKSGFLQAIRVTQGLVDDADGLGIKLKAPK